MATATPEIDKQQNYGNYLGKEKWKGALHKAAAHMALDIPEDMGIQADKTTTTTNNGMDWKGMVALAAALLGGAYMLKPGPPAAPIVIPAATAPAAAPVVPPVAPVVTPATPPVDSAYNIFFYNSKGELIDVPRRKPQ